MDTQAVVQRANDEHLRLVRFMYCDNGGIIRGKATHVNGLERRMAEGIGQSLAMQAFAGVDRLADVPGMGPVGEFRLVPDPETFVVLPYAPHTGMMLCDLYTTQDRAPWEACPRTFLKRQIVAARERGMVVRAAVEHEFYLARETDGGSYVPYDRSLCYSSIGFDSSAAIVDDILSALEQEGVAVEQFMPELGPAQHELSVAHAEALRAADNIVLVREAVRGVALRHALIASFAAKPFLDQAGSGAHIHFSLWGALDAAHAGHNLLYDPDGRGGVSALGYAFIGGILAHLPALLALTCASPNSYRRLLPHFWSSAYTAYGFDNREAAVRIPSRFWGREAESTNFELKPADHSGNPYLALGALIAAGLDGVARGLDPGEPVDVDPGNLDDTERERRGIARLPESLAAALDALEADAVLAEALGPTLAQAYIAVKRLEVAHCAEMTPEEEARAHTYKY
ncbi:MAG TPA: glutamine synthetase family protein [Ktedonobacterales bacterium]|nr:glutamine synthetase family protein [Ktedonobacterales bacterium]